MPVFVIDVDTTPKQILPRNDKRIAYTLFNGSSVNVYIGRDQSVSTSGSKKGVPLYANGGMIEDDKYKGPVWAVAEAKTEIHVIEDVEGE